MWTNNGLMTAAGVAQQDMPERALYVVGLPIGNLGDITLRALWVLSHVDAIAAEDTRETRKLLDKFGIGVRLLSVREHNERRGADSIVHLLEEGGRVALVTDAGTPAVSDPGAKVVQHVVQAGYRVIPIPGASASVTALSASGLDGDGFYFVGFLPPQAKAREKALLHYSSLKMPFVLYEAPHRIKALLEDAARILRPSRRVVVCRELTKRFETIETVRAGDLSAWAQAHEPRGEYVIVVDEEADKQDTLTPADRRWLALLREALPASKLAGIASKATGLPRSLIYDHLLEESCGV